IQEESCLLTGMQMMSVIKHFRNVLGQASSMSEMADWTLTSSREVLIPYWDCQRTGRGITHCNAPLPMCLILKSAHLHIRWAMSISMTTRLILQKKSSRLRNMISPNYG